MGDSGPPDDNVNLQVPGVKELVSPAIGGGQVSDTSIGSDSDMNIDFDGFNQNDNVNKDGDFVLVCKKKKFKDKNANVVNDTGFNADRLNNNIRGTGVGTSGVLGPAVGASSAAGGIPGGSDSDKGNVILITPVGDNATEFFRNPRLRKQALDASLFKSAGIDKIMVSEQKGYVVVDVLTSDSLTELCAITKLGPWTVKCSVPARTRIYSGVLMDVSVYISEPDIRSMLEEGGYQFVKVVRLHKTANGTRTATRDVRVDFLTPLSNLPRKIKLDYEPHTLREYRFTPTRCFNCQSFGHVSERCKLKESGRVICGKCCDNHETKDCANAFFKCKNCGEDHPSFSKSCTKFQEARTVTDLVKKQHFSYADAIRFVKQSGGGAGPGVPGPSGVPPSGGGARPKTLVPPRLVDAGTQTDPLQDPPEGASSSPSGASQSPPGASLSPSGSQSGAPVVSDFLGFGSLESFAVFLASIIRTVVPSRGSSNMEDKVKDCVRAFQISHGPKKVVRPLPSDNKRKQSDASGPGSPKVKTASSQAKKSKKGS